MAGGLLLLFPSEGAGGLLLALLSAKTAGMTTDPKASTSANRANILNLNQFTSFNWELLVTAPLLGAPCTAEHVPIPLERGQANVGASVQRT